MKELAPAYRLRKGRLYHKDISIPFSFGIVYVDDGQYLFELFLDEGHGLAETFKTNRDALMNALSLEANTDSGERFLASRIFANSIESSISKITAECLERITIEKPVKKTDYDGEEDEEKFPALFFIKLEGLKMNFSNHTEVKAYRNHQEISWHLLQEYNWDHSVCQLQVGWESYKMIWRKDSSGDIVVEFLQPEYQFLSMPFELWRKIKADFVSVLSFLNGAPVHVRTEYTGSYFSQPKLDSQVKHIYSFRREVIRRHSGFIPLNDDFQRGNNIINRVLFWDFNRYRYWNRKLDLNAIVHILGNAEQVKSVDERVYIQMILLERLSDSYALIKPVPNPKLIDESIFSDLKNALEIALKEFEPNINPSQFQTLRSRLFGLNDGKRQRTDVKIVAMLEDVGIEINEEIRKVITEDRHSIIHKGNIGSGKAFDILDKLLRKVIVKVIKYTGPTSDMERGEGGSQPVFGRPDEYLIDEEPLEDFH